MARAYPLLICLAAALVAGCSTVGPRDTAGDAKIRPVEFSPTTALSWLNSYRAQNGLQAVRLDSKLTSMAQRQANVMAERDKLSHSVDGTFASRVRAADMPGRSAENILYGSYTTEAAMRQWKASPAHDKAMRMPDATRFGIAWAQSYGPHRRAYWAMVIANDPPPPQAGPGGPFSMGAPAPGQTVLTGPVPGMTYQQP